MCAPRYDPRMLARALALALLLPAVAAAQTPPVATYRLPPKEIVDLVDAPPTPGVSFSPDRRWMLVLDAPSFPPSRSSRSRS